MTMTLSHVFFVELYLIRFEKLGALNKQADSIEANLLPSNIRFYLQSPQITKHVPNTLTDLGDEHAW
jgi:hypothetical protein